MHMIMYLAYVYAYVPGICAWQVYMHMYLAGVYAHAPGEAQLLNSRVDLGHGLALEVAQLAV